MISNNNIVIITIIIMNNDNKHYYDYMTVAQIHQKEKIWSWHYMRCWEIFCVTNGEQAEGQRSFSIR